MAHVIMRQHKSRIPHISLNAEFAHKQDTDTDTGAQTLRGNNADTSSLRPHTLVA